MREWVFLNPKYKNISEKSKSLTFVKEGYEDRHIHYDSFWKNWTYSLLVTAIGWSIWAVLIVLLNTLLQIEYIDYTEVTATSYNYASYALPSIPTIPTIPTISQLFGTTAYNFWITTGKVLGWIMFSIGTISLFLGIWQIQKIRNFRFNVYQLLMDNYQPRGNIEKIIIAEVLGVINYDYIEKKEKK